MPYLDVERLEAIDADAFLGREPYPWLNPAGLLTEDGYRALLRDLPDVSRFDARFGKRRKYGQASHDRYVLEWRPDLALPDSWRGFVAELRGPVYARFTRRLFGPRPVAMRLHWHYTPRGCGVSPHCDSKHKLGSHLFYFNSSADWDPRWGGKTLILDDRGRFHSDSNPDFGDFDALHPAECLDNRSLIFRRRGNSWHGVRPVACPEGRYRRAFIAVFERPALAVRLKRLVANR